VCAPELLKDRERPLSSPSDLHHHVLLHYDNPQNRIPWLDWPTWLEAVGLSDLKAAGAIRFNEYDQVVVAAASGQGVALGRSPLLKKMFRDGKLVAPFSAKAVAPRAYYLITSKTSAQNPDVTDFTDWLFSETGRDMETHTPTTKVKAASRRHQK